MVSAPPGRLSTMICWPSSLPSSAPRMRATVSVALPAACGTISRTGLSGYSAAAGNAHVPASNSKAAPRMRITFLPILPQPSKPHAIRKSGGFARPPAPYSVQRMEEIMSFRITGLPAENFDHLFALDDAELRTQGAVRTKAPGAVPCRISLTDATPGDEVILTNYEHHAVDSPYRMRFAIYVRKGEETYDKVDEVPEQLRKRTLAARAFDQNGMMVGRELVEGTQVETAIERLFATPGAAYLHLHYAAPGCYAARVERA